MKEVVAPNFRTSDSGFTKPLTKKMIIHLQEGRSIELTKSGRNICLTDDFKGTLAGLYKRGCVRTKKVILDNKEILGIFITQTGLNILNKFEEEKRFV